MEKQGCVDTTYTDNDCNINSWMGVGGPLKRRIGYVFKKTVWFVLKKTDGYVLKKTVWFV